jgi:hypothetical protein
MMSAIGLWEFGQHGTKLLIRGQPRIPILAKPDWVEQTDKLVLCAP